MVREWEESGTVYRSVTYHVGTFKGKPARVAAFFGFPKGAQKVPGLLHLHGGGQRAFLKEVEFYAKRGYACLSVNWGGREMENAKAGDPNTDWGAVDPSQLNVPGYSSMLPGPKQFFEDREHPKNNNWYLLTLGCRRALTFLEQQPEVDAERFGVHGYSMGGNLVLKAAGEMGGAVPAFAGVVAVCPNIDPTQCVAALEQPRNWIYHQHFLSQLKARMKRKAGLFPGKWDLRAMGSMKTISQFDDYYTARDGGYRNGADYYDRAGARHVLSRIAVPTMIITAQDDPFIPYSLFTGPELTGHRSIALLAPRHGGHCGFFSPSHNGEDSYWAENRIVEFVSCSR